MLGVDSFRTAVLGECARKKTYYDIVHLHPQHQILSFEPSSESRDDVYDGMVAGDGVPYAVSGNAARAGADHC